MCFRLSVSPDQVAVVPYSSGTTGLPKGVQLSQRNLVANMAQCDHPAIEYLGRDEVTVCLLPLFHILAINGTMSNMLWRGGKLVLRQRASHETNQWESGLEEEVQHCLESLCN